MSIFGPEFEKIWPAAGSSLKFSDYGKTLLKKCLDIKKPEMKDVDIQEFKRKSSNFPLEFGTNTCRVMSQPKDRYPYIQKQIASAYPIIHERVLKLYLDFLEHKSKYGTDIEKEIYAQLSIAEFVQRLLTERCASFFGKNDKYLLMSRVRGCSGFMEVGTKDEKPPLILKNVLSYDEIKLSAFLSVSSYTEFINDGNRQNCGIIEKNKNRIEYEGVVIGIIGARLNRRHVMEFQDIIITEIQNTSENGYGLSEDINATNKAQDYRRLWTDFYEERDFLYDQVLKDNKRFGASKNPNDIFDNLIMKKRLTISFDTLLMEGEARAKEKNKLAYIHVVGIGLGVWKVAEQQEKIFLECFSQRIKHLISKLTHIGVIHFSWFQLNEWKDLKNNIKIESETHPNGGIHIYINKRNPADKLNLPEHNDMLLIVSYAWDGNALPGNEFWMKMLKSTGDSSTACSTLITELHNPFINENRVNGKNLHIASEQFGNIGEQKLYKNLELTEFVQRLLTKRCVCFMGPKDFYLLLTGDEGQGDEYLKIGTKEEIPPLVLDNVISYDEVKLSAFLTVSSHTDFINDGNRHNCGVVEENLSKIERSGVVVGLIGARFERFGVMEYQDVIIDPLQNIKTNGYGTGSEEQKFSYLRNYRYLWNNFYDNFAWLYEQVIKDEKRFGETFLSPKVIFDNVMMKKRYTLTFDTLLMESEARAQQLNKQAYIHVVGIGLGVWKAADQQTKIFLETFTQRLKYLLPRLNHIGVVHFSWFHMSEWGDLKDNGIFVSETHPQGGIKTYLSARNPNEKLIGNDAENMLLIVSYAWDGNALPGNEFWLASLDGSNDPSTVCSSLISELHNPHINDEFVCGPNLHIATLDNGVMHISDYVEKIKDKF
uniref:Uncharacterized protein n=1 Tax=Glossina brevipalpis TaxID=37001 RepID=A0A1A9X4N1_9MUSC